MKVHQHLPHRRSRRRPAPTLAAIGLALSLAVAATTTTSSTSSSLFVRAMHADEAGTNDFALRTAGHGRAGVRYAHTLTLPAASSSSSTRLWITSESNSHPSAVRDEDGDLLRLSNHGGNDDGSNGHLPLIGGMMDDDLSRRCSVAARSVESGEVSWRVDACASPSSSSASSSSFRPRHATLVVPSNDDASTADIGASVFTMDDSGVLRGWSGSDGALVFDVDAPAEAAASATTMSNAASASDPRVLGARGPGGGFSVAGGVLSSSSDDEFLVLYDGRSGNAVLSETTEDGNVAPALRLPAKALLKRAKVGPPSRKLGFERAHIVDLIPLPSDVTDATTSTTSRAALLVAWSGTSTDVPGIRGSKRSMSVSSYASMAWIELEFYDSSESLACRIVRAAPFKMDPKHSHVASTPLLLSTLRIAVAPLSSSSLDPPPVTVLAVSATASQLLGIFGARIGGTWGVSSAAAVGRSWEIDALHPYWRFVDSINIVEGGDAARVGGVDDRYPIPRRFESLFLIDEASSSIVTPGGSGEGDEYDDSSPLLRRVHGPSKRDDETHHGALLYCPTMGAVLSAEEGERIASMIVGREASPGETVVLVHSVDGKGSSGGGSKKSKRTLFWTTQSDVNAGSGSDDGTIVPVSRGGTEGGLVTGAFVLDCSDGDGGGASPTMTAVFATRGGMTVAVKVEKTAEENDGTFQLTKLWSTEEALGGISSAIFLDEMHAAATATTTTGADADAEEDAALRSLEFSNRILAQVTSLRRFFLGGGFLSALSLSFLKEGAGDSKRIERDVAFGFAKVGVVLSETMHRVVALDTADKGRVLWGADLNPGAQWHKLVHGGQFASLSDPRGNGGVHDHEMLALSYIPEEKEGSKSSSEVEWKCFDGVTGRTFASKTVSVNSEVAQVVPLRASSHHHHNQQQNQQQPKGCRQVVLLIHADDTATVVPDTPRARAAVDEAIAAGQVGRNGLFVHTVDGKTGEFRALRVVRTAEEGADLAASPFRAVPVGTASFDPTREKIVNVAYPRRGEAIQNPSTILGDDALLLKYLNPHLVVIVTEATPAFLSELAPPAGSGGMGGGEETTNGFYNALTGSGGEGGRQQRKPLGAGKSGADAASTSSTNAVVPSLFVSLVDSVSGQILHRVSHAHAAESDFEDHTASSSAATRVPVVISENWVVYSFFNRRTRRTDVGVLTLHEGMIDKHGITAFNAPEQELTFSSLESAKPIVLSKTYGLAKTVTALGVTTTKGGISSKQFLLATGNDQVVSIDRRILDPRRPNGELKETEKMEGLMKYAPLLPIVPLRTPSHVLEVSSVRSISSASANVESQSLILAFGGPDIFFSRLAPSKGFDLLPDDFNFGLLSVVLVGLIGLLKWVQRMNSKKLVTTIWS